MAVLRQVKTLQCVIENPLFMVYKITSHDDRHSYLMTRTVIRSLDVLRSMALKRVFGNLFIRDGK